MENRRIETRRLVLKPITQEDAPAVFAWASDPEVNRYMPYPLHKSIEQTRAWIASLTPEMLEFGFYRKENGQLIGTGGVGKNEEGAHTLGYNLRRDAWGHGYATEAAQAMLAWAYHSLGVRDFALGHAVLNTASGNVARKCGFQLTHYGQYSRFDGSETFDAAFYELHLKGDEAYVH
mgnify:FL=1